MSTPKMIDASILSTLSQRVLELAESTAQLGNYPIAALLTLPDGTIVAEATNRCASTHDVTAHAEMLLLKTFDLEKASKGHAPLSSTSDKMVMNEKTELTLISSLEPCFGCSFFLARMPQITKVISILRDPYQGGLSDLQNNETFAHFFQHISHTIEPDPSFAEKSRSFLYEYFLKKGKHEVAKRYLQTP